MGSLASALLATSMRTSRIKHAFPSPLLSQPSQGSQREVNREYADSQNANAACQPALLWKCKLTCTYTHEACVRPPTICTQKQKKTDGTSRQTRAGIGHSAPAHRGGHVQNRISRRQVRRGKIEHSSEAEQPRTD